MTLSDLLNPLSLYNRGSVTPLTSEADQFTVFRLSGHRGGLDFLLL